jgi:hypothetical protein
MWIWGILKGGQNAPPFHCVGHDSNLQSQIFAIRSAGEKANGIQWRHQIISMHQFFASRGPCRADRPAS